MSTHSTQAKTLKAVLVGVQLGRTTDQELNSSLDELSRLVTTLGYDVIGRMSQRRSSTKGAAVLGDGKLKELSEWTGGSGKVAAMFVKKKHKAAMRFNLNTDEFEEVVEEDFVEEADSESDLESTSAKPKEKADVVIFDCDLSPSQLRNLESATGVSVLDRTGVIIEIFSRHARTRAARLQVEIARLSYVAPRIREVGALEDRQGGGGGKGAGESSIELDRRKIRDRIKELKNELGAIGQEHLTRRSRRAQENCVALVGYTNAGKSSLMRAMTGSDVLVADKLFATLDTTVRSLHPETQPKILLSDTVGFIKKLPHDLVASFKSTLDEAHNASLLLYVVDSSDPFFRSQLDVTRKVLSEVGVEDTPSFLILNKRDRLSPEEAEALKQEFPEAIQLSTRDPQDLADLRARLVDFFEEDMVDEDIIVPYKIQNGIMGEIRNRVKVLSESYDGTGVKIHARGAPEDFAKIRSKMKELILDLE